MFFLFEPSKHKVYFTVKMDVDITRVYNDHFDCVFGSNFFLFRRTETAHKCFVIPALLLRHIHFKVSCLIQTD